MPTVATTASQPAGGGMPICAAMPADLRSILDIEVPVIVQIASRRMAVQEVMNLAPGAIIELPKLADEELEILVSDKPIGVGRAVKVGENFGIRITYIGDLRARIAALASSAALPADGHDDDPGADPSSAGAEPVEAINE